MGCKGNQWYIEWNPITEVNGVNKGTSVIHYSIESVLLKGIPL